MASTAQATPLKILAVGPAVGLIRELLAKVKSIDAKHGKFELALCVGDFFGPPEVDAVSKDIDALLAGELEVTVPTYVMQGDQPIPQSIIQKFANSGSEICPNLFLLTKSGFLTTSQGLRIACLGGIHDETIYSSTEAPLGFSDPYFSSQTVEKLLNNITASTPTVTSSSNMRLASLAARMGQPTSMHYVDILVSQTWPASITQHTSSAPLDIDPNHLVPAVDDIVRRSKPRYYFATGASVPPQFWEREPFTWPDDESRVTRFVSLGAFGGEYASAKKPRWFYAFSIVPPSAAPSATQAPPANATANPFLSFSTSSHAKRQVSMDEVENFIFEAVQRPVTKKAKHEMRENGKPPSGYKCRICQSAEHLIQNCPERGKPPEGYVCKICNVPGHLIRDCPEKNAQGDTGGRKPPPGYACRACASENHFIQDCPVAAQTVREGGRREAKGKQRGPPKEIGPNECWFCLSNPNVAKHLLVSIGEECYVTLPKGQIIPTAAQRHPASKVPGGGHVLIVPITHYPTLNAMPPDLAIPIVAEIEQHKSVLRALYAKHDCGAVVFEVGILSGRGGHAHVQVVPVPYMLEPGKDASRMVEEAFRHEGAMTGVVFEEDADAALQMCAGGRANYFRVDLPDGRKMVHLIKQEVPFSIQFGRQVLCKLLGVPERMDWKACGQSEVGERADAQAFKQAFAPFDLTQAQS